MFLKPDKTRKVKVGEYTLTINEKIIPNSLRATKNVASWCKAGAKMKPCAKLNDGTGKPRGITVHNTGDIKVAAGTTAAEQYTRATFNGNMGGVVVHFYVWDNEIWQNLNENERGWHATDGSSRRKSQRTDGSTIGGNLDTIAIECIGNRKLSEDTTAMLVAHLCKKYGLNPKADVYTHNYFYPVKNCPQYILPHWSTFLASVQKYYNELSVKATTPVTISKSSADTSFKVKVICNTLNIRKGASTVYASVGKVNKNEVYTIVATNTAKTWGKLKSGAGWICIKSAYVKRV